MSCLAYMKAFETLSKPAVAHLSARQTLMCARIAERRSRAAAQPLLSRTIYIEQQEEAAATAGSKSSNTIPKQSSVSAGA